MDLAKTFLTMLKKKQNPLVLPSQKRLQRKKRPRIFTLTIDPLDARDFDDAISIKTPESGDFEIGVHIADVANYVKKGSALDKEARRRANSTYLVGEVVPMLPHSISSGLCSLVEGEDRLVKSLIFRFSSNYKLLGHHLFESVICSDKRLTYEQAMLFWRKKILAKFFKHHLRLVGIQETPVEPSMKSQSKR